MAARPKNVAIVEVFILEDECGVVVVKSEGEAGVVMNEEDEELLRLYLAETVDFIYNCGIALLVVHDFL